MGFTHPGNPLPLLCLWLLLFRSSHARFFSQGTQGPGYLQKVEITVRSKIGSRPPLCERRCTTCSHCEPVQVPAVPQARAGRLASGLVFRGDDGSSNYKPVSWKCKCGNLIFNP